MANENKQLNNVGISGESKAMDDCLRATTEWFMQNDKKMLQYKGTTERKNPTLFYTDDADKIEKIIEILKEV